MRLERPNTLGHELLMIPAPVHLDVEVGSHLEQLGELRIKLFQQVINERTADKDDLDIQGNRLGLQGNGADQAEVLLLGLVLQLLEG